MSSNVPSCSLATDQCTRLYSPTLKDIVMWMAAIGKTCGHIDSRLCEIVCLKRWQHKPVPTHTRRILLPAQGIVAHGQPWLAGLDTNPREEISAWYASLKILKAFCCMDKSWILQHCQLTSAVEVLRALPDTFETLSQLRVSRWGITNLRQELIQWLCECLRFAASPSTRIRI